MVLAFSFVHKFSNKLSSNSRPFFSTTPLHERRPKEIKEIRDFLQTARRKDAHKVKIMTKTKESATGKKETTTKFKIRCSKVS
jgi:ribosomal protein L31E